MRQTPSPLRFCAALLAVLCLTLAAAAAAHAGKGKPNVVRTTGQHAKGGHGFGFGQQRQFRNGHFQQKHFHKHGKRSRSVKRRSHKRRHVYLRGYTYDYDRGYRYRNYPQPTPSTQSYAETAAPSYRDRPVTPKWISVSNLDGALVSSGVEGAYDDGGLRRNCLSVKTQITVDGKPLDAFGEACISADGTWELTPSEQNE